MALTAREVVFYIRAQNQASGAIRRVARDMGSLKNLKGVQDAAARAQIASQQKIARIEQSMVANREAYNRALATSGKLSRQAATGRSFGGFTAQEIRLKSDAAASAVARLSAQQRILETDLKEANIAADAQAEHFTRLGKAIPLERMSRFFSLTQRIGHIMTVGGLIGAVALGASAHAAAGLQSSVTLAATQARPVGAPVSSTAKIASGISTQVITLMKQFPASAKEMSDAYYEIFSGTNIQSTKKATDLLKTFNEMAVAGGTDLKTMTDAGISLYNNFPTEFKNMTGAANAFFATVRYGRMNASQFANSLSRVLPIARAAGLTFKDVADAMAFVTRQTGGARTGLDATGLARLIEMLGNKNVIAGLAKYGIQVKDTTGKMRPLMTIISEIHDKFVATGKLKPGPDTLNFFKMISAAGSGGAGTAGTVQGRRVFDFLLTDMKQYQKVSGDVNRDNNEMVRSFEAMNKTPGVQWARFTNQIKAFVYEIGTAVIPVIIRMGKPLGSLIKWFDGLSKHSQRNIAYFAAFTSVGLLVAGMLITVASAVGHVAVAIKLMQGSGGLMAALGLGAEGGASSIAVAIRLGIVAALVALIVVLIKYPKVLHEVSSVFGGLKNMLLSLAAVITAFTIFKLTSGFVAVGTEAGIATSAVGRLRLGLLGIAAIGAITIPIVAHTSSSLSDAKIGSKKIKYSHGLAGLFGRTISAAEYGIDRVQGMSPAQAKAALLKDITKGGGLPGTSVAIQGPHSAAQALYTKISNSPYAEADTMVQAAMYYSRDNVKGLQNIWNALSKIKPIGRDVSARQVSIAQAPIGVAKAAHIQNLSKTFMSRLQSVGKLELAYEKTHALSDYKKYQDALLKLNSDYNTKLYQGYINDYLSRVNSANTKSLAKSKKDNSAYLSQLTSMYSNVMSTYQSFLQQNQSNFGSLFQGPFMQSAGTQAFLSFNNQKATPAMLLKDLHSQLFQFNRFNSAVGHLAKKGAPQTLIDQLNSAGPSAASDIQALNRLTPKQLKDYIATWNRGQAAIKANTMKQLNSQLSMYQKFGTKVAQAIIAGIQSQDPKLESQLEAVINRMFPDLVKKAGKAVPSIPHGSKKSLAPKVENHYHFSPTIHSTKTENVGTALKKSYFHMKQHTWY